MYRGTERKENIGGQRRVLINPVARMNSTADEIKLREASFSETWTQRRDYNKKLRRFAEAQYPRHDRGRERGETAPGNG